MKYLLFIVVFLGAFPVYAQIDAFRSTEYPLPRFVSLDAGKINVRAGPGEKYPILWVFHKRYLPVEIILEFEHWRKIRDHEGQEGWIHKNLLSGRRTGLLRSDDVVLMRSKPDGDARVSAKIEPRVVVQIEACEDAWCKIDASGYRGWTQRKFIWGVYENENFD